MINHLGNMIQQKKKEVAALKMQVKNNVLHPYLPFLQKEKQRRSKKNFKSMLADEGLSVIAEIKRKSPSKGLLAEIEDPIDLANRYTQAGAKAISILTDETFFGGHLTDLSNVSNFLKEQSPAILRKDFIIDEIQIAESIIAGADAILAMVAVLKNKTKNIIQYAKEMEIDVLVEIHNYEELEIAVESGAEIIGVNNRNLKTLEINTETAFNLISHIPKSCIKVAESGILSPPLAQDYYKAGFDAVLIGEALVTSHDCQNFIEVCCNACR